MKTIGLASDHAGFELKEYVKTWLEAKGYAYKDFGTYSTDSCDYPDFAHQLAVAIEAGDTDGSLIGISYHSTWTKNDIGEVKINDKNYTVIEFLYAGAELSDGSWRHENGILPANETTYPNLSQVYIKSAATNEDIEKIDGNDNGKLDILVLSQAVQADGFANANAAFEAAFGVVNATNAANWFAGLAGL